MSPTAFTCSLAENRIFAKIYNKLTSFGQIGLVEHGINRTDATANNRFLHFCITP